MPHYQGKVSPPPQSVRDFVKQERPQWRAFYLHKMPDGRILADEAFKTEKLVAQALDVTSLYPAEAPPLTP
jgi:hypothetical protein